MHIKEAEIDAQLLYKNFLRRYGIQLRERVYYPIFRNRIVIQEESLLSRKISSARMEIDSQVQKI